MDDLSSTSSLPRPVNSSPDDELGSCYNQGATTSAITLKPLLTQLHNFPSLLDGLQPVDCSLPDEPGPCYYQGATTSDITYLQAAHLARVQALLAKIASYDNELVTALNIARMLPQMPLYDSPRAHFPLNHVPYPDYPLPDLDSLPSHLQFDSSASALSNQPNDLGARPVMDHTTYPAPRVQCVFNMCRPEPNNDDPIELRRENLIELGLSLRTGPDQATLPWEFIRVSNTGAVERSGIRRGRATLDLVLEVRGATTGKPFTSACPKCSKRASYRPPNSSLFDFVAKDNLVEITGGNARIGLRFRCSPRHHGTTDREYRLSATISDGGQILGQHQYPNWIRIVHHPTRGRNRPPVALQQANEISSVVELGESEESHGVSLNAHFSGVNTSGTFAGGPLPVQTSANGTVFDAFTQIHRTNEVFEPGWRGGGLSSPASAARSNNRIHEEFPVLSHINPSRGPKKGGDEIYLIVSDLSSTTALYARFGGKIVPTSHIAPGVLSCRLPAAVHPGVVEVTLCQTPSLHDEGYGKSLVSFEYEEDSPEALIACWNTFNGGDTIDPGNNNRICHIPGHHLGRYPMLISGSSTEEPH